MIDILLAGASGAMGRMLDEIIAADADCRVVAGFDANPVERPYPVFSDLSECEIKADVIIDFSHFSAFDAILAYALDQKLPLVVGTTGLSEAQLENLRKASAEIPVFKTANMSLGINVLAKALREIAAKLDCGFDVEIIEKHHNLKKDAPSGTALLLGDAVNAGLSEQRRYTFGREGRLAKRESDEIGIHAIRGGTISGEHTVLFAGCDEVIEIKHTAYSKKVFAKGAVTAAKFIIDKSEGLFDMNAIIDPESEA